MAGGPKYSRFKSFQSAMSTKEMKARQSTINVREGKGKYPTCLKDKPYPDICPEQTPKDPKNVPKQCKFCPEHLESPLYARYSREERLKRLQTAGLPTKIVSKR